MNWTIQFDWCFRLLVAALCGGFIGYERSSRLKNAGMRTHIIVAIASALIMIVSKYGFADILNLHNIALDPSRIAAQIISGISFIGAGTIIVRHDNVNGLTTAAGVWATAAVGMAIGGGMYFIGVVSAFLIVLIQQVIRDGFILKWIVRSITLSFQIIIVNDSQKLHGIRQTLQKYGVQHIKIRVIKISDEGTTLEVTGKVPHSFDRNDLLINIGNQDGVEKVSME